LAASIVVVQVLVSPEQAPPHPAKVTFVCRIAVSVTAVPLA
jgi:hypothetical protein